MTDEMQSANVTTNEVSQAPVENTGQATQEVSQTTPEATASVDVQPKAERLAKMYSRDELNKIINAEKNKAYEKARLEANAELQRQYTQQAYTQQPQVQAGYSQETQADTITMTKPQLDAYLAEREQQVAVQHYRNKIAGDFMAKFDVAKQNDPELEVVFQELEIGKLDLSTIDVINSVDNVGDVLKEFSNHPRKLVDIELLAKTRPQAAKRELQNLANSIRANKDALSSPIPKAPLSPVKSSVTASDNGKMTCSDLRKLPEYQWW